MAYGEYGAYGALGDMGSTVFMQLGFGAADLMWTTRGGGRTDVGYAGGCDEGQGEIEIYPTWGIDERVLESQLPHKMVNFFFDDLFEVDDFVGDSTF